MDIVKPLFEGNKFTSKFIFIKLIIRLLFVFGPLIM